MASGNFAAGFLVCGQVFLKPVQVAGESGLNGLLGQRQPDVLPIHASVLFVGQRSWLSVLPLGLSTPLTFTMSVQRMMSSALQMPVRPICR